MGCTESSQVLESKRKLTTSHLNSINSIPNQTLNSLEEQRHQSQKFFIFGSLPNQNVFANVKMQSMEITKMPIPSGDFVCYNFASMLEIEKDTFFICGGINYNLTLISDSSFLYFVQKHKAERTSPMLNPRYTHSSLYYQSRKSVYVFGGRYYGDDDTAILSKCEKYDIDRKEWIALPAMNVKRCTSYSFIWNKKIYICGGYTGPYQRSTLIEYLDENDSAWVLFDINLNRGLEGSLLITTDYNEITIFGGLTSSGATDSVISINLIEQTIRSKPKLLKKRSLFKGFYNQRNLYIFGGDDEFTSEIYNLSQNKSFLISKEFPFDIETFDSLSFSTFTMEVPFKQITLEPTQPQKQQIICILGTTDQPFICEVNLDVQKVAFKSVPIALKLHANQGGVFVQKEKLLLFGGREDDSFSVISSETFLFDRNKNCAKKKANMNQNRFAFTYQPVKHNKEVNLIYCFGGATSNLSGQVTFLSSCERYSISKDSWELMCPMPEKLMFPMSLKFKDYLFVFGGTNSQNSKSKEIYSYDLQKNLWTSTHTQIALGMQAGSLLENSKGEFYLFGGLTQKGESDDIWRLDFIEKELNHKKVFAFQLQHSGKMKVQKSYHRIYRTKNSDFYIVFGGQNPLVLFYQQNLQEQTADSFENFKNLFEQIIAGVSNKDLKNYLIMSENENLF